MKTKRILAVHLLNDFSGSPFVLSQSLRLLIREGYAVELFTATPSGNGFLSGISGLKSHRLFYRWHKNRWLTLLFFLYSQAALFFRLLVYTRRSDLVYINSLLPFGAALAAKLRGCKIIYHIHEVSVQPPLLKRFLLEVANRTASRGLFVSEDLRKRTVFRKPARVVYNALPDEFVAKALCQPGKKPSTPFTILMACSLKKYKGVHEFVACAGRLSGFRFVLVLNASPAAIRDFFRKLSMPSNLELVPAQQDLHPYYQASDVVMNLSRPGEWVETFGMTVLEAMYYRKPVIVPPVGGVIELVTDEVEGYRVDSASLDELCNRLEMLAGCQDLYRSLSLQAFKKAKQFTRTRFESAIREEAAACCMDSAKHRENKALQLKAFRIP